MGIGLTFDLGRWYNIWHPAMPWMWQGNSVLFEVAMCVMIYLTILYIEFLPIVCERFIGRVNLPGKLARLNDLIDILLRLADHVLGKVMFIFIIAGVMLSCLTPLSRMCPYLIGAYMFFRLGDMLYRGTYVFLFTPSVASMMFWIEFGLLTVVPFFMFMSRDVRRSPSGLLIAAVMYIAGVVLNRCTVFFIAYKPPYAEQAYIPTIGEFALTIGLLAAIIFVYRVFVTLFPVLPAHEEEGGES